MALRFPEAECNEKHRRSSGHFGALCIHFVFAALWTKPEPMRNTYILPCSFLVVSLFAGHLFRQPAVPSSDTPDEAMAYFKNINLAARALYDNDFFSAAKHYEAAFQHKATPFYLDLKNAIIVNNKCGFYAKNNALLKLILQDKQVSAATLAMEFPPSLLDSKNLEYLRQLGTPAPKPAFNPILKKALLQLHHDFQDAGGLDRIDLMPGGPKKDSLLKQGLKMRDSLNALNALKFIQLVKKQGFPTEERIGFFMEEDLDIWTVVEILITSWLRHPEYGRQIFGLMETAFKAGSIPANVYGNCLEYAWDNWDKNRNHDHNVMNITLIHSGNSYYRPFVFYSDSLMNLVNKNRLAIGLDSFHIAQKQWVCTKFCPTLGRKLLPLLHHYKYFDIPRGFVKNAFKQAGMEMESYRIDIPRILEECHCEEKLY